MLKKITDPYTVLVFYSEKTSQKVADVHFIEDSCFWSDNYCSGRKQRVKWNQLKYYSIGGGCTCWGWSCECDLGKQGDFGYGFGKDVTDCLERILKLSKLSWVIWLIKFKFYETKKIHVLYS